MFYYVAVGALNIKLNEIIIRRSYDSYKAAAEGLILSVIELSVTTRTGSIIRRTYDSYRPQLRVLFCQRLSSQ